MFHDCARSAAEPSQTPTKTSPNALNIMVLRFSATNLNSTNSFRLRLCESHTLCTKNPSNNARCPRKSFEKFRNFGHHVLPPTHLAIPMLTPFARWLHKSRAKCRITLWDKLCESLREEELVHDCARAQLKHQILAQNTSPNHSNSWFSHFPRIAFYQFGLAETLRIAFAMCKESVWQRQVS